jgi:hypothetical protein
MKDPYKNLLKSADSTLNNLEALDHAFAEEEEETTLANETETDPISVSENNSNGEEINVNKDGKDKDQNDDGKMMTRSMSVLKNTDIMPHSITNTIIKKGTKNIS